LIVDFILFLFFYFDVLIILNNVKIKVDERTHSGKEIGIVVPVSDSQKTINRKQYVLIFFSFLSFSLVDWNLKLPTKVCIQS
jgi:hypothetical protein